MLHLLLGPVLATCLPLPTPLPRPSAQPLLEPAHQTQGVDRDLQNRITPVVEVVQVARPSVAFIQSNVPIERRDFWNRVHKVDAITSGSGVVLFEDGYLVTNNHVVKDATKITVRFDPADDPRTYEAQLISADPTHDLALIKIEGGPFPALSLGANDPLLGETVIAIGNPYGQTHTVSTGIISGLHRDVEASGLRFTNLIQTDASINPGNSGGPLLNINGELIGINTAMNTVAENIGFAIPVDKVKSVLEEQLLSLDKARAWLGFILASDEFKVERVVPGSPAALAGLLPGDRLTSLSGRSIQNTEDYRLALLSTQPTQNVTVEFARNRRPNKLELTAWDRLDGYLFERLGMTVATTRLGNGYRRYLQVQKLQEDGPAASLGLEPGDILEAVQPGGQDLRRVTSTDELAWLLSRQQPSTPLTLYIWHDDDGDGLYRLQGSRQERYKGTLQLN